MTRDVLILRAPYPAGFAAIAPAYILGANRNLLYLLDKPNHLRLKHRVHILRGPPIGLGDSAVEDELCGLRSACSHLSLEIGGEMASGDNKALVSRIADEIWNRGNLAAVDEVMVANVRYHGPHMPNGVGDRESWRRAVGMYLGAFPDSHVTFEELITSGDTVVGRWSATGTHSGQLPGVDATGKRIAIGGITIYRIADGKIIEAWEQLDLLGMWQQLGVVALPDHE